MATIKLDIPHSLPIEEAKKRVQSLLGYWDRKYNVKTTWTGDVVTFSGKTMGISIDGRLTIAAGKLSGDAGDPGFLLRAQAEKYLKRKFADYLDPNKTLADLARDD